MKIFYLPDLGEGLAEAEIHEWYVESGDEVKVDQPLVSMETAKAVVDVPAPRSGRIQKLYGQVGDIIKTGAPLIEFEEGEETGSVVGHLEAGHGVLEEAPISLQQAGTKAGEGIKAIPAVRALAKRLNIDLNQVTPSGAQGQITLEDVEKVATGGSPPPLRGRAREGGEMGYEPLRGVRRTMVATMIESHQSVVPITLADDANIHAWPAQTDITLRVIRAIIAACRAEPALNAWFDAADMSRRVFEEIHLGLAMDTPDGLFVPVLKNVEIRSAEELRATIERLKTEVRERKVSPEELKGATFVLSNVGIFAGRYFTPIIVPPTVAILATGRIYEVAVVHEGKCTAHRHLPLSLSIDHRVVTGGEATRFLAALIKELELK